MWISFSGRDQFLKAKLLSRKFSVKECAAAQHPLQPRSAVRLRLRGMAQWRSIKDASKLMFVIHESIRTTGLRSVRK
jgi:hypothetical protein